jgi:Domain of unknown function (DUF4326)
MNTTPTRITLSRAKGWRKPEGAIVVSRGTMFGNPWVEGCPGVVQWPIPGHTGFWTETRFERKGNAHMPMESDDVVMFYDRWLQDDCIPIPPALTTKGKAALRTDLSARRTLILSHLPELRGHDLCCWCKPGEPCHADILIRMANG